MTRFLTCLLSLSLLLLAAGQARADLIDFETQAAGRGGSFTGKVDSPLVIGIATFTGGELLKNEIGGVDKTGVYATTSVFGGVYSNPLKITFSQAVSGFSIVVTNNSADSFTVADNLGGSKTQFLSSISFTTFSLSDTGITSVTISSANANELGFVFAIDNVSFTPNTVATPEPASLTLLGIGGLGLIGYGWRKRKRSAA
jgi:hypothetical protein